MEHNVIAVIWDFDKTLINGYMQDPVFAKYNVDAKQFWKEVNNLPKQYKEKYKVNVNKETIYLNHFITCVEQGIFSGLNNNILFELGKKLSFYQGVPEIFSELKKLVEKDSKYKKFDMKLEHYIVSTGLSAMIKGSIVAEVVDGVWGCEFIEEPIKSNLEIKVYEPVKKGEASNTQNVIKQIGCTIDNTSKTRAIFEINKGANKMELIDVNAKMNVSDRRIPFENMLYIADGPSDVPVFSLLKQHGGKTYAIYAMGNEKEFEQVDMLRHDGRIDMYGEANYTKGTQTYMWLTNCVKKMAEQIYQRKMEQISQSVSKAPVHIVD